MLPIFDGLRDIRFGTVLFRMALALLCGMIIGLARSYKNRAAGFRTHVLICCGGTIASMTGLYLYLNAHISTDVARLGAQVVSGLGFIGAGTIIVNRNQEQPTIRGLNTAAGLWATGIIGLALGAGFYEGALAASVLILLTETVFYNAGRRLSPPATFRLTLHYKERLALDQALRECKDERLSITDLQVTGFGDTDGAVYTAVVFLRQRQREEFTADTLLSKIRAIPGILDTGMDQTNDKAGSPGR